MERWKEVSVRNAYNLEQSPLVWPENTHIPLLTQVSVQLPPNIPARCSPLRAWTQQTLHWAAGSEWQGSSCLKQYTSGSSWVLGQMVGACCTLGVFTLGKNMRSHQRPLENCVRVPNHGFHHQCRAVGKKHKTWEEAFETLTNKPQSPVKHCIVVPKVGMEVGTSGTLRVAEQVES